MRTIRILLVTAAFLQAAILKAGSSDRMNDIADMLTLYGAAYSYVCDYKVRNILADHESDVGYEKCCQDYYELLSHVAKESAERNDTLMYDLGMCCHFMAWQNGKISTKVALADMEQLMKKCRKRMGDKSFSFITASCVMAEFYCAVGDFDAADRCCQSIVDPDNDDLEVTLWQHSIVLHARMVAQVGRGMFSEAWKTAVEIVEKYNQRAQVINKIEQYYFMIEGEKPSSAVLNKANRLARQMALRFFPSSTKAVESDEIEPWPLILPEKVIAPKSLGILGVVNLHELFQRLRLSEDFCVRIVDSMKSLVYDIYDYDIYVAQLPPLAVEIYRRSAETGTQIEKFYNIDIKGKYNYSNPINEWERCACVEQFTSGKSSAVPLLHVVDKWIKKGQPVTILPFAEEATSTMLQELSSEKKTQLQLMLKRHDREWLKNYLPELVKMVADVPEYKDVILELQSLQKTYTP